MAKGNMTDQEIKRTPSQSSPRKRAFALARNPIIAVPYLLSIPLALFTPEDVFAKWAGTKTWFDFVSQYVPIVANYPNRSAFPQVTGLYFSIVVAIAPCVFWAALTTPNLFDEQRIKDVRARVGILYDLPAWIGALGLVFLAYFALAINPGYDFNVMPINRSRIALALFGPLFAGGLAGLCLAGGVKLSQILLSRRG